MTNERKSSNSKLSDFATSSINSSKFKGKTRNMNFMEFVASYSVSTKNVDKDSLHELRHSNNKSRDTHRGNLKNIV